MATPLTAAQMYAALLAEGVNIVARPGWETHNRNHKGAWGPVHGIVIHHTAGVGSGLADYCSRGSSDLPGPVCHGFAAKDARTHLIGHGRTNHAGSGSAAILDRVIAESGGPFRPGPDEVDGNSRMYGLEIENRGDGRDPYPAAQYDQAVRWAAAICRAHGWTAQSVIGHGEWTRRKVDPSFPMDQFRRDVAARLNSSPAPKPPTPPKPSPSVLEPFPGATFFRVGRRSQIITEMGRRLVAEGCGRYKSGPGPEWTEADRQSYAAFQRKLGYSGADADGYPGPTSWAKLRIPKT
ncbi:peptidoglycan-binding protein [Yinghuangia sp. YIM S09857]|uniref:peptidoglycan-binding protein n=1 Tax=Yinghuangia sp. YIM S09857 TaxID=3436929 RepID=UPI003F52947F